MTSSPRISSGAGWPHSTTSARGQVGVERHHGDRGEPLVVAALGQQHLLDAAQHLGRREPGEHQRPPGDAQRDPERRLVGTVAAHVADQQVHAGRRLHDVVEVAAEQGPLAAGSVERRQLELLGVHQRAGQQAALQAGVLLGPQLGGDQLALVGGGPSALDRVAQRALEARAVDLALDEEVLRAGGQCLRARSRRRSDRSARRRARPGPAPAASPAPSVRWRRAGRGRAVRSRRRPASASSAAWQRA